MPIGHSSLVLAAQRTAYSVLDSDGVRLAHVRATAQITAHVGKELPAPEREAAVAAAWLHDIGYAPALMRTGFHPLDGALHLAAQDWPDDVVRLVAHHSFAAVLAPYYGVADHLTVLDPVGGRSSDVLTFADVVAGVDGSGCTIRQRIDGMRARHAAADSPVPADVREARYALLERTALTVLRSVPSGRRSLAAARI